MDLVLRLCSEFVGAASAQKSLQVSEVKEDGQIPSLNKETNPWSLHVLRDISRPSRSNASTDPVESDNPNMHEQRMGGAFVSLSLLHLDRRLDEPIQKRDGERKQGCKKNKRESGNSSVAMIIQVENAVCQVPLLGAFVQKFLRGFRGGAHREAVGRRGLAP